MTVGSLIDYIAERLIAVGYRRISTPFLVASIRFDFTAALQGKDGRSSDLVLLIDTSMSDGVVNVGERTRQRLETLSRALDIADSNMVLTAVLAGAAFPPATVDAIARSCRVLLVSEDPRLAPAKEMQAAQLEFDDRIRVLLPLQLGEDADTVADPLNSVLTHLRSGSVRSFAEPFLRLSVRGDKVVSKTLSTVLGSLLSEGLPK